MSVDNVILPTNFYFGVSAATGDLSGMHKKEAQFLNSHG
jgi:hypothetical protein